MSNDDSKPPNFWALQEEDLQEWRQLPVTVFLLQALQADMDNHLKSCAEASMNGQVALSSGEAGMAYLAERYFKGIAVRRVKAPEPETQDTTFHDRATRLSTQVRHG
jgi:hypothetical protein